MLCHCHGVDLGSQKNLHCGYIVYRSEVISDGNSREWQQPTTKAAESATGSSSNDYRAHTLLPVLQVAIAISNECTPA